MWPKTYRDYPIDTTLKKERVEASRGIYGCEMHELNGWGQSYHHTHRPKDKGVGRLLLRALSRYFR